MSGNDFCTLRNVYRLSPRIPIFGTPFPSQKRDREWKISFPTFGDENEKFIPNFRERELEASIPENGRERKFLGAWHWVHASATRTWHKSHCHSMYTGIRPERLAAHRWQADWLAIEGVGFGNSKSWQTTKLRVMEVLIST